MEGRWTKVPKNPGRYLRALSSNYLKHATWTLGWVLKDFKDLQKTRIICDHTRGNFCHSYSWKLTKTHWSWRSKNFWYSQIQRMWKNTKRKNKNSLWRKIFINKSSSLACMSQSGFEKASDFLFRINIYIYVCTIGVCLGTNNHGLNQKYVNKLQKSNVFEFMVPKNERLCT